MRLLMGAIDCGASAVQMLPRGTGETRLHYVCTLSMELLLVFDEQVRELSRTDQQANGLQKVQDFWLAHPICIVQRQDPRSHFRPKLALVACRKISQIRSPIAG